MLGVARRALLRPRACALAPRPRALGSGIQLAGGGAEQEGELTEAMARSGIHEIELTEEEWAAWEAAGDDSRSVEERAFIKMARGQWRSDVDVPMAMVDKAASLLEHTNRKALKPVLQRTAEKLWDRTDQVHGKVGWRYSRDGELPYVYGADETLAYVAFRLVPAYSMLVRVFEELQARDPEWRPRRVLDFGAGPGTGLWAATETWRGPYDHLCGVEASRSMSQAAETMCGDMEGLSWRSSLKGVSGEQQFDLAIASQVLSELPHDLARAAATQTMWQALAPGGALVILERGSPGGSHTVRSARELVLGAEAAAGNEAHVVAPCSHDLPCPMASNTWCHFSTQVDRFDVKGGRSRGHNTERFSYVVLRKGPLPAGLTVRKSRLQALVDELPSADADEGKEGEDEGRGLARSTRAGDLDLPLEEWARQIRQPIKNSGHILMDLCTPEGRVERRTVSRANSRHFPAGYIAARKSRWGALWPF